MSGIHPPFLSLYDPADRTEGSIDPLGMMGTMDSTPCLTFLGSQPLFYQELSQTGKALFLHDSSGFVLPCFAQDVRQKFIHRQRIGPVSSRLELHVDFVGNYMAETMSNSFPYAGYNGTSLNSSKRAARGRRLGSPLMVLGCMIPKNRQTALNASAPSTTVQQWLPQPYPIWDMIPPSKMLHSVVEEENVPPWRSLGNW